MLEVYISHSSSDQDRIHKETLKKHLKPLRQRYKCKVSDKDDILAGSNIREEVENLIQKSHVVLLLMSPDFLSEKDTQLEVDFIFSGKKCHVIPIIIRACVINNLPPYEGLQILPNNGDWIRIENQDSQWVEICEHIGKVLKKIEDDLSHKKTERSIFKLLEADYKQQYIKKREAVHKSKSDKLFFLFLEGQYEDSIHHFILKEHPESSYNLIKANEIPLLSDDQHDFWNLLSNIILDHECYVDDPKEARISFEKNLKPRLKEEEVVCIIYDVQLWGVYLDNNFKQLVSYLKLLSSYLFDNNIYVYVVYTGDKLNTSIDPSVIHLDRLEPLNDSELIDIGDKYATIHFDQEDFSVIQELRDIPNKTIASVVDFFLERSRYSNEMRKCLNKIPLS